MTSTRHDKRFQKASGDPAPGRDRSNQSGRQIQTDAKIYIGVIVLRSIYWFKAKERHKAWQKVPERAWGDPAPGWNTTRLPDKSKTYLNNCVFAADLLLKKRDMTKGFEDPAPGWDTAKPWNKSKQINKKYEGFCLFWICLVAWLSSTKCRGTQKVLEKASGDPAPGAVQPIR